MRHHSRRSQLAGFETHLEGLTRVQRRRVLSRGQGHDFASNDYLGLATSARLVPALEDALSRGVPIGSGGSRLLRGNHPEHQALELEAASFFGSEASLFLSSGYAANSVLLSTLPQSDDLIIYDELIHASSHEGTRLARSPSRSARHNDCQSFADQLRAWRSEGGKGHPWIVIESLYSMEGDKAPLGDLLALADQHDGFLVVDEAHATGVFGHDGRGLADGLDGRENVIAVRTCGKALGCEGALICGPRVLIDFLINRGRGFIFSTAPSPLIAAAVREALKINRKSDDLRHQLQQLVSLAASRLQPLGAAFNQTQILPLIIGDAGRTMALARSLQGVGFDVRAIRPPTVPDGTSRLRIPITLNVDRTAIDALADALERAMK